MEVYVFLFQKKIQYFTIDLDKFNIEKDFEVCALKLNFVVKQFYYSLFIQITNW